MTTLIDSNISRNIIEIRILSENIITTLSRKFPLIENRLAQIDKQLTPRTTNDLRKLAGAIINDTIPTSTGKLAANEALDGLVKLFNEEKGLAKIESNAKLLERTKSDIANAQENFFSAEDVQLKEIEENRIRKNKIKISQLNEETGGLIDNQLDQFQENLEVSLDQGFARKVRSGRGFTTIDHLPLITKNIETFFKFLQQFPDNTRRFRLADLVSQIKNENPDEFEKVTPELKTLDIEIEGFLGTVKSLQKNFPLDNRETQQTRPRSPRAQQRSDIVSGSSADDFLIGGIGDDTLLNSSDTVASTRRLADSTSELRSRFKNLSEDGQEVARSIEDITTSTMASTESLNLQSVAASAASSSINKLGQQQQIFTETQSRVLSEPLNDAANQLEAVFRQSFQSILQEGEKGFEGLGDRVLKVFENLGQSIQDHFIDLIADAATGFVTDTIIDPSFGKLEDLLDLGGDSAKQRQTAEGNRLPSIPGGGSFLDRIFGGGGTAVPSNFALGPGFGSAGFNFIGGNSVGAPINLLTGTPFSVGAPTNLLAGTSSSTSTAPAGFALGPGAVNSTIGFPGFGVGGTAVPASTGLFSGPGLLGGGTGFSGVLGGAGIGAAAGSFLPTLGIGNAGIGNTLGSTGGALAGAAIGSIVPGIGTVAGGLAGGLLGGGIGGLFGGGDPGTPQSFAKGTIGAIEGFTDNGGDAAVAVQALNAVLSEAAGIAEQLGVEFRQTADAFLQIDQESGAATARIGDSMGQFGSAAEATDFLLQELIGRIVEDVDPAFKMVIDTLGDLGLAIEAIQFIQSVEALPQTVAEIEALTENLPPLEQELRGIQERFDQLATEAERLGLATGALAEEFKVAEQIEAARLAQLAFTIRGETDALVESIASQFEDLSDFNDSPLEREIRGLVGQFDQLAESARGLGLAEAELMRIEDARQSSFSRIFNNVLFGVEQEILSFQNPVQAQIQGFKAEANRVADQLRAAGEAASLSPEEIEAQVERVRVLKRLRIDEAKLQFVSQLESQLKAANDNVRQFFDGLIDPLDRLQQDLISNDLSALSPGEQLSQVRDEFDKIAAAAARGELQAIADLPGIAQQRLQVERLNFATGPQFGEAFREVNAALLATQSEIEQERDTLFADFGISVTTELKDQTATLREELQGIRRELKNVRDQLEAA